MHALQIYPTARGICDLIADDGFVDGGRPEGGGRIRCKCRITSCPIEKDSIAIVFARIDAVVSSVNQVVFDDCMVRIEECDDNICCIVEKMIVLDVDVLRAALV